MQSLKEQYLNLVDKISERIEKKTFYVVIYYGRSCAKMTLKKIFPYGNRIISIIMILCILFGFAVCGNASAETEQAAVQERSVPLNWGDNVLAMKEHSDYSYLTGEVLTSGQMGYHLYFVNSTAMIPVRLTGESLGFTVSYKESTGEIVLSDINGNKVEIKENSNIMKRYRYYETTPFEEVTMPVEVRNIDGRTYLPLRSVSEALNCQVEYREETNGTIFVLVYKPFSPQNRLTAEQVTELIEDYKLLIKPLEPVYQWLNVADRAAGEDEAPFSGDTVGSIPVLECYMDDGQKKPVVIVEHGVTMCKENMLPTLMALGKAGFHAIAIDAYGHGRRQNIQQISMIEVVVRNARDVDTVLSYYENFRADQADVLNFGTAGFSMGGMSAFYQAAYGSRRPAAIVPVAGTPDWLPLCDALPICRALLPMSYDEQGNRAQIEGEEALTAYRAYAQVHQPMNGLEINNNLAQTPMLMMIGSDDATISPNGCQSLFNILNPEPENQPNPNVELIVYQGQGHAYTQEEITEMVAFLKKHLLPTEEAQEPDISEE